VQAILSPAFSAASGSSSQASASTKEEVRLYEQELVVLFFKSQGRMVQPIQRVNLDLTATMLEELDPAAQDLNLSRQAVI
jgi:hypothetical protein